MRWVPHATYAPHQCAFSPVIRNHNARAGFFVAPQPLRGIDPIPHLSVEALELMARQIGWQPASATAPLEERIADQAERIAELEAQLVEADQFKAAAEYTMGKFGTKIQNKPGRKPAKVA